jgi:hypothetical protein
VASSFGDNLKNARKKLSSAGDAATLCTMTLGIMTIIVTIVVTQSITTVNDELNVILLNAIIPEGDLIKLFWHKFTYFFVS